MAQGMKVTWKN